MIYADFWMGLSTMLSPMLAMTAGAGITTAIREGYPWAGTSTLGAIFFSASVYWAHHANWAVHIGSYELPGEMMCLLGFLLGLAYGRIPPETTQ